MSDLQNKNQQHLTNWINGDISNQEFKTLVGNEDYQKYHQILNEVDNWQPSSDNDILDPQTILAKKGKTRFLTSWRSMSIAASILAIIVISFIFYQNNSDTVYYSDFGQTKEILLPDGKSTVILGSNSTLTLVKMKASKRSDRFISLVGKAHFKVSKGAPFKVQTSSGMVEVLGTQFDVNQFDKNIQVICYEGKVRATSISNQELIISAGESSIFYNDSWEEKQAIQEAEPSWIQDEIKFTKAPLLLVIKELKEIYDIEFELGEVNLQRRFTGSFPKNNLEQALQIVFSALEIKYEIEDKTVFLKE